jgi:tetratricopeptide (TPR) repeat protein
LSEDALPLYRQVGAVLGEANSMKGLGDIALDHACLEQARAAYGQAAPLYHRAAHLLGEADCLQSLGDVLCRQNDWSAAREHYEAALALYARIPEPYGIGAAHFRLVELTDGAERTAHVAAAREAWTSIDRPDLVALLDKLG